MTNLYSRDFVISCELLQEFKEDGIMVEFSGALIDFKDDFTGATDEKLPKIKVVKINNK